MTVAMTSFTGIKRRLLFGAFFSLLIVFLLDFVALCNMINHENGLASMGSTLGQFIRRPTNNTNGTNNNIKKAPIIAYAISITACDPGIRSQQLYDGAAVLMHSIRLNSIQTPSSGSKYNFEVIAFVHPSAQACSPTLEAIGYKILVRDTPIDVEQIRSEFYKKMVVRGGCCGEKEFLKLYSYTLMEYPAVLHLDTDSLILQPLDDLFDALIINGPSPARDRLPIMWRNTSEGLPHKIDAFLTRDYNMVNPDFFFLVKKKAIKKITIQGGFLLVRPDMDVFEDYRQVILEGDYKEVGAWGDEYGQSYGDRTIQGICAFYYGHYHPGTAVELNRCKINQMVDNPQKNAPQKNNSLCTTGEKTCEDCRITDFADVKSMHFTECGKPWDCKGYPIGSLDLCAKFHQRWFQVRKHLEDTWTNKFIKTSPIEDKGWDPTIRSGMCRITGTASYVPIKTPSYEPKSAL